MTIISAWSPIHLRDTLKKLYWRDGKDAVGAMAFWEDMQRYLYLPTSRRQACVGAGDHEGRRSKDFFGTAMENRGSF